MIEIITTQKARSILAKNFKSYDLSMKSGNTWVGKGFTITKSDADGYAFSKYRNQSATVRIDYKINAGAGIYNPDFVAKEIINREQMLNAAREIFESLGYATKTNFDGRGFVVINK